MHTPGSVDACIVLCETRADDRLGVKLLLASLARHAPRARVLCYLTPELAVAFDALRAVNARAELVAYDGPRDWSCKPLVLLDALARNDGRPVLWLDTDMIVLRPFADLLPDGRLPDGGALVVAEECNPNANARVRDRQHVLGLREGPPLATTLSSCVIGVSAAHRPLLEAWRDQMAGPLFRSEQALAPRDRKVFHSDQEVWEAVVCSAAAAGLAVRWLRNDVDLLHATYTGFVRTRHYARATGPRRPFVVHAIGNLKPWREVRRRFVQEIYPYFREARRYRPLLTPDEAEHLKVRSLGAWAARARAFRAYRSARQRMNARKG